MAIIEMTAETCETVVEDVTGSTIERVTCGGSFAEVAPQWLELQANGIATPYQAYDWCRAWVEATGVEPMLVTGVDRRGRTVAILPLGIRRKAGLAIASFLGDKHANIHCGLFDQHATQRLGRADIESILRQAAVARGVDLYLLRSQPIVFRGSGNPLAQLPRITCAASCWSTPLLADGEAMIRSLRSSESLKKLRAKARKLGEIGPLAFVQAEKPDCIKDMLAAFFAQKTDQFQRLGIDDPYADPAIRSFLLRAMQPCEGRAAPVSLWALKVGDRIAAVFGGATHAGSRTGMFISYDPDPALARCSPGELLLQHVIRASCDSGLTRFDLGTGDGPYKKDYCPVPEPLFDSVLPMSPKGRLAAPAIASALALKGFTLRNPVAVKAVARLRKAKAALRRG